MSPLALIAHATSIYLRRGAISSSFSDVCERVVATFACVCVPLTQTKRKWQEYRTVYRGSGRCTVPQSSTEYSCTALYGR